MPTVTTTAGATNANSYADVAGADTYFAESFGRPLWANQEQSDKEILLITASRTLDQFMSWVGEKSSEEQGMEWPRLYAYDRSGAEYSTSEVPRPVVQATYELAYHILLNGGMSFTHQEINSVRVGPIAVEMTNGSTDAGIPEFIESMINHIGTPTFFDRKTARSVKLVRS